MKPSPAPHRPRPYIIINVCFSDLRFNKIRDISPNSFKDLKKLNTLALTLIVKHYIDEMNEIILTTAEDVQNENNFNIHSFVELPFLVGETNKIFPVETLNRPQQKSRIRHLYLETRVENLRKAHFMAVKTCATIDRIFSKCMLLFYANSGPIVMICLYMIVVGRARVSEITWSSVLHLSACAIYHVVVGLVPAASAGATAAAAHEEAARTTTTLLLAAGGNKPVQREARLFLLQLRANRIRLSVGGLVSLDLKFYMGLAGSIVCYLMVAIQFVPGLSADDRQTCSKLNCTSVLESRIFSHENKSL
ncbi:Protein of unknown function [Gryllus bimaculatus]|nr:Protein of unknown function [Gryllus bimaculatus]